MTRVPLSSPDISDLEIEFVTQVLRSNHLSLGPWLTQFEESFAKYAGRRYAIAANSGTSALHMCVRAMGFGRGDEVITTSFSFVASANCLLYEGAVPVFVDIDPRTLNIDPHKIREFLERNCYRNSRGFTIDRNTGAVVRAILPVHVFGLPCDMAEIHAIAEKYDLLILEDACEALGAEYRGKKAGTFGKAAVFAFYPNKQMTTGEGGMVVTDDEQIAEECRSLRNQGRDVSGKWLNHVRLGFNYRLSDVHSAIGLAQLARIEALLAKREKVASLYNERLGQQPALTLPFRAPEYLRSWFVYVIQFGGEQASQGRKKVQDALASQGIATQVYFPAIHRQPYYPTASLRTAGTLAETEKAAETCLALPFSSRITESDADEVCDALAATLSDLNVYQMAGAAPPAQLHI
jgi:perosamine synthetase